MNPTPNQPNQPLFTPLSSPVAFPPSYADERTPMSPPRTSDTSPTLRDLLPCVVKIFTTHTTPSYARPWQMARSSHSTSAGFIISARRILTNAHCVADYAQVLVRRPGNPQRYAATVLAIGRDCDLAMLTVDAEEFWHSAWKGAEFVDIAEETGKLPDLEERVSVIGYPQGGEGLSVTSGVVSRIEMQVCNPPTTPKRLQETVQS